MNPSSFEMFIPIIKQALSKALRDGATSLVEEFAESFSADDLDRLIGVLQKVAKKKKTTVDQKTSTP